MTIAERIRGSGLRCTPVRTAVLRYLCDADRPVAHGQVLEGADLALTDRVTVYRALDALVRAGLVHRVQGIDGAWRYRAHEPRDGACPGGHPHFLCRSCGEMTCLEGQALPWVELPEGTHVDGKQLLVYGVCPRCARTTEGSA